MERGRGGADGRRRSTWGCCFCIQPPLPDDGAPTPARTPPVQGEQGSARTEPGTLARGAAAESRAPPAAALELDTPEKLAGEDDLPVQDPAAIAVVFDLQEEGPRGHPAAATRPASTHDGAVVMHAIPQLKLAPMERDEVPRPSTPPMITDLPYAPAPIPTPRRAPGEVVGTRKPGDGDMVQAVDQTWVDSSAMEMIVEQTVDAISQCILVTHWTSSDTGCLITLESAPGSPGMCWHSRFWAG